MTTQLKRILINNIMLKMVSFIIGFCVWYVLSRAHTTSIWLDVPVCFEENGKNYTVLAPEKVAVQLVGKRRDLATIDTDQLAVHMPTRNLMPGSHHLVVNNTTLFLPTHINVVNYCPTNATISILEKTTVHPTASA